jgi:hypothetical protein
LATRFADRPTDTETEKKSPRTKKKPKRMSMHVIVPARSRYRVKVVHEQTSPEITRELAALGIEMTSAATTIVTSDERTVSGRRARGGGGQPRTGNDRRRPEVGDILVGDRGGSVRDQGGQRASQQSSPPGAAALREKQPRERSSPMGGGGRGTNYFPLDRFERRLDQLRRAVGVAKSEDGRYDRDTLKQYRRRADYRWRPIARPRAADHYVAGLSDRQSLAELGQRWATSRPRILDRRQLAAIGVPGFAVDVLTAAQALDYSNYRAQGSVSRASRFFPSRVCRRRRRCPADACRLHLRTAS